MVDRLKGLGTAGRTRRLRRVHRRRRRTRPGREQRGPRRCAGRIGKPRNGAIRSLRGALLVPGRGRGIRLRRLHRSPQRSGPLRGSGGSAEEAESEAAGGVEEGVEEEPAPEAVEEPAPESRNRRRRQHRSRRRRDRRRRRSGRRFQLRRHRTRVAAENRRNLGLGRPRVRHLMCASVAILPVSGSALDTGAISRGSLFK